MANTQALSQKSLSLLQSIRDNNQRALRNNLVSALIFIIAGIGFAWLQQHLYLKKHNLIGVFFIATGLFMLVQSIFRLVRNSMQRSANPLPVLEYTIHEQLTRIEVIDKKFIRYHFTSQQIDVHIPSGKTNHTIHYDRLLHEAESLINTSVKLTYTTYTSGINVLLNLVYDHYQHTTSIVPLEKKDRKNLLTWVNTGFGLFWGFLFLVTFTGIVASRFDSQTILVMLAVVMPIAVLSCVIWYFQKLPVTRSKDKKIITTVVSEKITVLESGVKTSRHDTYYRLADGHIFHTSDKRFKPGDTVIVTFMQDTNGANGRLIAIARK